MLECRLDPRSKNHQRTSVEIQLVRFDVEKSCPCLHVLSTTLYRSSTSSVYTCIGSPSTSCFQVVDRALLPINVDSLLVRRLREEASILHLPLRNQNVPKIRGGITYTTSFEFVVGILAFKKTVAMSIEDKPQFRRCAVSCRTNRILGASMFAV